jgi:hypothetical protein
MYCIKTPLAFGSPTMHKSSNSVKAPILPCASRCVNHDKVCFASISTEIANLCAKNCAEKCGNFVNISQSPVCTAHLMQRTRKFASARGEMVANGGGTASAVMGGARGKAAAPALTVRNCYIFINKNFVDN